MDLPAPRERDEHLRDQNVSAAPTTCCAGAAVSLLLLRRHRHHPGAPAAPARPPHHPLVLRQPGPRARPVHRHARPGMSRLGDILDDSRSRRIREPAAPAPPGAQLIQDLHHRPQAPPHHHAPSSPTATLLQKRPAAPTQAARPHRQPAGGPPSPRHRPGTRAWAGSQARRITSDEDQDATTGQVPRHRQDPLPLRPSPDTEPDRPDPHSAPDRPPLHPADHHPRPTSPPRPRQKTRTPPPPTAAPTHAAPAPNAASPPLRGPRHPNNITRGWCASRAAPRMLFTTTLTITASFSASPAAWNARQAGDARRATAGLPPRTRKRRRRDPHRARHRHTTALTAENAHTRDSPRRDHPGAAPGTAPTAPARPGTTPGTREATTRSTNRTQRRQRPALSRHPCRMSVPNVKMVPTET